MKNRIDNRINIAIKENALFPSDWAMNELAWNLYWLVDFFNIAFFKDEPVPIPVLTFECTRVNNFGYYRKGLNDWEVKYQININRLCLDKPFCETLSTLLHEMVHSWESVYVPENKRTRNWYHKIAFREKLASCGILIDKRGCHIAIGDPFRYLLARHAVHFDRSQPTDAKGFILNPQKPKPKGKSKLLKWSCGCTNARVAIARFKARCLTCGNEFKIVR